MIVRSFVLGNDYKDISQWWSAQGWPVISDDCLTPFGYIAEQDNQKIACTFLYPTPSAIFVMEWTVGNPELDWKIRSEGITLVTNRACDVAKEMGAKYVFTMTKHERYIEKLEDVGFMKTDVEMTHFMRRL